MEKSENESEKRETLADIVAQIRAAAYIQNADTSKSVLRFADRIEAAWKREKSEIEADALAVGGIVEAERHTPGNAAAMREALLVVKRLFDGGIMFQPAIRKAHKAVDAALAAPARNCDLARDWLQDLYCEFKPPATVRREMPPEWVDAVMAFCKWLLAPAAEQEGGAE